MSEPTENEIKLLAIKMARVDGVATPETAWRDYETSAVQALSALHIMSEAELSAVISTLPLHPAGG